MNNTVGCVIEHLIVFLPYRTYTYFLTIACTVNENRAAFSIIRCFLALFCDRLDVRRSVDLLIINGVRQ